jgi:thioredoxin 1
MNSDDRVALIPPDQAATTLVDEANFESLVLNSKLPSLVAFYTPWSRPCQILNSSLDEVIPACAGRAQVVRVNADDHPYLSLWYAIQSIPTLLFFVNGHIRAKMVGAVSKEIVLCQLQSFFPGGSSQPPPSSLRNGSKPYEYDDW